MQLEQPGVLIYLLDPHAARHSTEVTKRCSATLPGWASMQAVLPSCCAKRVPARWAQPRCAHLAGTLLVFTHLAPQRDSLGTGHCNAQLVPHRNLVGRAAVDEVRGLQGLRSRACACWAALPCRRLAGAARRRLAAPSAARRRLAAPSACFRRCFRRLLLPPSLGGLPALPRNHGISQAALPELPLHTAHQLVWQQLNRVDALLHPESRRLLLLLRRRVACCRAAAYRAAGFLRRHRFKPAGLQLSSHLHNLLHNLLRLQQKQGRQNRLCVSRCTAAWQGAQAAR